VNHSGRHLPFETDITSFISSDANYWRVRFIIAINNTLTPTKLPPGELHIYHTHRTLETPFDFFNYAGIDRSVILYFTSSAFIEDINIGTQRIDFETNRANMLRVLVEFLDANEIFVANNTDFQSDLFVNKPNLWEPCGMNHTYPCTEESYLYTLQVTL